MIKCPKCGLETPQNSNFCEHCGTKISHLRDAITQLSDAPDEKKVEIAVELLKNPNHEIRNLIISELANLNIRAVGVWFELVNRLADEHESVRKNSAEAFWKLDAVDYAIRSLRDEYENPAHMRKPDALRGIDILRQSGEKSTFENLLEENWEHYPGKKSAQSCPECDAPIEELKGSSISPYINTYKCTQCNWAKPRCGNTMCDGIMNWEPTSSPGTFRYVCTKCGWSGLGPRFVV
jgi:hypothetical protein